MFWFLVWFFRFFDFGWVCVLFCVVGFFFPSEGFSVFQIPLHTNEQLVVKQITILKTEVSLLTIEKPLEIQEVW